MRKIPIAAILLAVFSPVIQAGLDIKTWETTSGAQVYFIQAKQIPIADIRVVFDAGSARDAKQPGLGRLTNRLLSEGAGQFNADQLAKRLDQTGAQLGSGSLRDMAWLSLRTVTEQKTLQENMSVFSTILNKPTFPQDAIERNRKNMLVSLQASKQRPGALANKAFMKALYGDHPYAWPPGGTETSLKQITSQDIKNHYRQYYVAKNATLAIVGALSVLQAKAISETITKGLSTGSKPTPLPKVKPLTQTKSVHIQHPSSQTHILVGQTGMKRLDQDYYALYVGNHAFGGSGLVSQLNTEVREKRGYAYSVYSYFSPMRQAGPFLMAAQTKNESAKDALHVMKSTLQQFIQEGIQEQQLTASKRNITGGFALRLDSNKKLVSHLSVVGFYDLGIDYLNQFSEKIQATHQQQVAKAFGQRIDPKQMLIVTVGPKPIASW